MKCTNLLQVTPSLAINYTAYGTLRSHWLTLYGEESSTVCSWPGAPSASCMLVQGLRSTAQLAGLSTTYTVLARREQAHTGTAVGLPSPGNARLKMFICPGKLML